MEGLFGVSLLEIFLGVRQKKSRTKEVGLRVELVVPPNHIQTQPKVPVFAPVHQRIRVSLRAFYNTIILNSFLIHIYLRHKILL